MSTLQELVAANIHTWIFGGWAEELWGLRPPGPHGDVDLIYPAENFRRVDQLLQSHTDLKEMPGKRFVHKRAFARHGILIEIFLLRPEADGFVTDLFGLHQLHWPEETLSQTPLLGVLVPSASPAALRFYRNQHRAVEQTYRQHLASEEKGKR